MYTNQQKRFYSPPDFMSAFSALSAVSVRRRGNEVSDAWALGLSMPKAVDDAGRDSAQLILLIGKRSEGTYHVVGLLPSLFSPGVVCLSCKDNTKCNSCAFSQQAAAVPAV
jgi:hypothetical protein